MVSRFLMIFRLGGKQSYDYSVCMGLDSTVNFCNYICPKLAGGIW